MQKRYQMETVSVVIGAYNNPEYTRKTLKSIVEQNYRPLEVILSDDNSPTSLETLAAEFAAYQDAQLTFRYYRQSSNLGMSENYVFGVNQATGKYLIPMSHDNWFTDPNFISEAVEVMQNNANCYLCLANCIFEKSKKMMLTLPDQIPASDSWELLGGDRFIRLWRTGGLGWTQIIVLDTQMVHALKAFDEPYQVNKSLARKLNLADDNLLGFVFVLSAMGSVALTGKVVCEVGQPADSYSRSSKQWLKTRAKVKFVILYNIYKADLAGKFAATAKATAKQQAYIQAMVENIFDLRVIRHYHFKFEVIWLLSTYMRKKLIRSYKNMKRQLKRRVKALVNG